MVSTRVTRSIEIEPCGLTGITEKTVAQLTTAVVVEAVAEAELDRLSGTVVGLICS